MGAENDERSTRDSLESSAEVRERAIDEDATAKRRSVAPQSPPATTSPSMAPAAKAIQREPEAPASADDSFAPAPPEDWIRRIRELRDRGDQKGARDLLNSFRARYPDYVLPEDLRQLSPG